VRDRLGRTSLDLVDASHDAKAAATSLSFLDCVPKATTVKVLVSGCFHDEQRPNICRPPRSDLELDTRKLRGH
jgi:hypothetical protein